MSPSSIPTISLNDYLGSYMTYLQEPINVLNGQKSALEVKLAIFSDLKEKLEDLKDLAEQLAGTGTSSSFLTKSVTSSNTSVLTATASSSAASGAHSIFVTQLARAHTVASGRYDQDATALGSTHAGTKTFSITIGSDTYDVSVEIASDDTNEAVLGAIASAINEASNGSVSASVILDTPTTARLTIASGTTGTVGTMSFADTDGLLSSVGATAATAATDTAGGYIYADLGASELDALLTVDGLNVVSSSNQVENMVTGLSINLLAEQEAGDAAITLTVDLDVEAIKSKIAEFLDAYNDTYEYLYAKTAVDGATYTRGVLAGDFSYISLRSDLRGAMVGYISGTDSVYQALSQIGITSSRTGTFSISDSTALEEALEADIEGVAALFDSEGGIASALDSMISQYVSVKGTIATSQGAVKDRIDRIEDSIDRQERTLSIREKSLRSQYYALQEMLYALQSSNQIAASLAALYGL
jgi:flagellar hook-associated protein 2